MLSSAIHALLDSFHLYVGSVFLPPFFAAWTKYEDLSPDIDFTLVFLFIIGIIVEAGDASERRETLEQIRCDRTSIGETMLLAFYDFLRFVQ